MESLRIGAKREEEEIEKEERSESRNRTLQENNYTKKPTTPRTRLNHETIKRRRCIKGRARRNWRKGRTLWERRAGKEIGWT
jgi:hypothetical protein